MLVPVRKYAPSNRLYMAGHDYEKLLPKFHGHLAFAETRCRPIISPKCEPFLLIDEILVLLWYFQNISDQSHCCSSDAFDFEKDMSRFRCFSGVRNRWVSVFDALWFGLVYARNECTVLTDWSQCDAHIVSKSLCRSAQHKQNGMKWKHTTFYQNDNKLLVSMTECSTVVICFGCLWRFRSPEQIKKGQKLLRHSLHILLKQRFAEVQSIQLADTG